MIGFTTGRLTVIGRGKKRNYHQYWICQCTCGRKRSYTTGNLKKCTLVSCGCFKASCMGKAHKNWRGFGDVSATVFSKIKGIAARRGIGFSITIKKIAELFEKQGGRCALSGLLITLPNSSKQRMACDYTASLDRKDSKKSYNINNVQWVHKDVNMMKQHYDEAYFKKLCIQISKH